MQRETGEASVLVASQLGCASAGIKVQQLVQNLHLGKNGRQVCGCNLFEGVEEGVKNGSHRGK